MKECIKNKKMNFKKTKAIIVCNTLLLSMVLSACGMDAEQEIMDGTEEISETLEENIIRLNGTKASINGNDIEEFEYTWHSDPAKEEEWYEGEKPDTDANVYIAHDIWYYPQLNEDGFSKEKYDGETEWVYKYTADGLTDYVYATLPAFDEEIPKEMMHSAQEAYEDPVLHIVKPGTYVLEGKWDGQIFVNLGDKDETFADENAKVVIKLNGVEVTCDSAPAFIAYSAYECDNQWEEKESWSCNVDTTNAGVQIVVADGTLNQFSGANVYRMLKPEYKKNSTTVQKKAHKIDGAFYSFVSMNINGEEKNSGILNITSTTFEGLDSELHLTINGGNINIYPQDDGININEDDVSVFTMNAGTLHIFSGLGREGDVIDSNGYIVVNGGIIAGGTPSVTDEILDSNCGNTINGGQVINIGSSREGMGPGGKGPGGMRPEGWNPEDMMPEGWNPEDMVPEGWNPEDMMPEGWNPEDMKPGDRNPEDTKQGDQNSEDTKQGDQNSEDMKAGDQNPEDTKQEG